MFTKSGDKSCLTEQLIVEASFSLEDYILTSDRHELGRHGLGGAPLRL